MNVNSEIHSSRIVLDRKARFLARFMYELTLDARNYYGSGDQPIDAVAAAVHQRDFNIASRVSSSRYWRRSGPPTDELTVRPAAWLSRVSEGKSIEDCCGRPGPRTVQAAS